jgi:hypothetical protein
LDWLDPASIFSKKSAFLFGTFLRYGEELDLKSEKLGNVDYLRIGGLCGEIVF